MIEHFFSAIFVQRSSSIFRAICFGLSAAVLALTAVSSLASGQSRTQDFELRTAGNLVNLCSELARLKGSGTATKNGRSIACQSYIAGAVDTVDSVSAMNNTQNLFCLPRGVGSFQLVKIVVSAGRRNPGALSAAPNLFVIDSLIDKYPCQ